ncbi:Type V secretory pathway, adhesin AidA [Pseudomonas cedrina]|uniref:Autotransporter outer membrane beta-barrel domain-containing protein n=2 Tax=Pseudomonas cedrina TaxID=651740 RepID=A0A1V2K0I0_PSECE|nr:autotransporter domain-containing protein [Pseudomonas cedrina]ONH51139.1 autotransporter outer membrane beta-barrel domain-containing protein [Pseudomonas cedrina subsp. cedrina]SDS81050.1 Type V secretory pathway, adhesin AidA [Pseudomonas cedrina]
MRVSTLSWFYLLVMAVWPPASYGACTITNTAGDDTSTCNSATAPGFTDTGGNNTLDITATGQVIDNVTYGAGNDLVDINGPSAGIIGDLNQGDGANIFRLNLGSVTGSVDQGSGADVVQISGGQVGAVRQASGIDSYAQSGGTVLSVAQGDNRDKFFMSGGTILTFFEDGDEATMTGGTIGRVDMKLDDNVFLMSGGRIIGNMVAGFGNDFFRISGNAFVGGNISVSGGDDQVIIEGGDVNGQTLLSFGNDSFIWTGGNLHSFVLMGAGDDTALLQNLVNSQLAAAQLVDGGLGNDTLTLDSTKADDPGLFSNWEAIQLHNSHLKLGGTLALGDSATGTGVLSLDGTSQLLVDTGVITSSTAGELVDVNNSGVINMTTGSSSANDTLLINGNYTGEGAVLALQTVLGNDSSASDKLIVNQGVISGSTAIQITNLGGTGAATTADGIRVVDAQNGATSSSGAFSLNGIAAAGPRNYYLYRGGVSAGTEDSWFLRSETPVEGPVTPLPAPSSPPLPAATIRPVPFIRQEVSLAATVYPAAQQLVRNGLGTFHERVGEQGRQRDMRAPSGWARVYGGSSRQDLAGDLSTSLDSSIRGYQVGTPVFSRVTDAGNTQHLSVFVGQSRLKGKVKGLVDGMPDRDAGDITLRGTSVGLSVTHISPDDTYVDVVGMHTRLSGNNESERGIKMKTKGNDLAFSVEVGKPRAITPNSKIEPQFQVIWNQTKLDSQNDPFSRVSYDADSQLTVRAGVRASGDYIIQDLPVSPYVRANVWHTPRGNSTVTFNAEDFDTQRKSTTLDLSLGATAMIARGVSLYGEVSHNQSLDSQAVRGTRGTLGVSVDF